MHGENLSTVCLIHAFWNTLLLWLKTHLKLLTDSKIQCFRISFLGQWSKISFATCAFASFGTFWSIWIQGPIIILTHLLFARQARMASWSWNTLKGHPKRQMPIRRKKNAAQILSGNDRLILIYLYLVWFTYPSMYHFLGFSVFFWHSLTWTWGVIDPKLHRCTRSHEKVKLTVRFSIIDFIFDDRHEWMHLHAIHLYML